MALGDETIPSVALPDDVIDLLLERPCWVVDFLPRRVPDGSRGQFFAVEGYFLESAESSHVFEGFSRTLLSLNCYFDLFVSSGYDGGLIENPDPRELAAWVAECRATRPGGHLNIVLSDGGAELALVVVDSDSLCLSLFGASDDLLALVGELAQANGLFLWKGND